MKKFFNNKKAQQLVEFLLVAPFFIIMLGILTEYAYALNINMTLTNGLKNVTSSIYSEISPSMTASSINSLVKTNLTTYLSNNNIPTNTENKITVNYVTQGQTAIFMANYTYIPAFTLPNIYFNFLPEKFNFFSTATVPKAFLTSNNYNTSITSSVLDKIWSSTANFSTQDSFNASKKGIMKDTTGRGNVLFLVPTTAVGLTNAYALVNWDGSLKKSGTDVYTLSTTDGRLYTCSSIACAFTGNTFLNYAISNGFYNMIFIHDTQTPANLSTLTTFWLTPSGAVDISASSVQGILKRALGLVNLNSNLSIGNYDNLDVSAYPNIGVSTGNSYTVDYFGSTVFVHTSADSLTNITNVAAPTYNYNFGSKVN